MIFTTFLCAAAGVNDGSRCFLVSLPAGWEAASSIRLILEGVTLPGNQPIKLRVTVSTKDGRDVTLASVGLEALSHLNKEPRRIPTLRVYVTRSLTKLSEDETRSQKLNLRIQPIDGRGDPLRNLKWSIDIVRLETYGNLEPGKSPD